MVFTCVTCSVAFVEAESQRLHFKTDWHRYNLKRKVAELAPVDATSFQNRLNQQLLSTAGPAAEPSNSTLKQGSADAAATIDPVHRNYCDCCRKAFASRNAFNNHLKAKKHREAAKKGGSTFTKPSVEVEKVASSECVVNGDDDDDEWSDIDDQEVEVEASPLSLDECTFCSHLSDSLESNMQHMTIAHSFFVPDANYLSDLEGLMAYLAEKVGAGYMCLWCNERGRAFRSASAAQRHMRDMGHCKLLFDADTIVDEYADFYDYSYSYPDNQEEEEEGGEEQEQVEDGDVACAVSEIGRRGRSRKRDPDESVSVDTLDDGGYELELPSGAVIGHRSLMRYYKQSLPPERARGNRALPAVVAHYRGLGWMATTGPVARLKARAIGLMHMKRSKHYMQLGVKANKLQKHFREQVLF